jgi:hypothetical protein
MGAATGRIRRRCTVLISWIMSGAPLGYLITRARRTVTETVAYCAGGMSMDFRRAFYSGVIGGGVTSLVMIVGRSMDVTRLNVELALGSMLTHNLSNLSGAIGVLMFLLIAGLIGIFYATGFVYVTQRASWAIGLLFSLVHLGMTGLVINTLGDLHPLVIRPPLPLLDGHLLAPGLFAVNFGVMTVVGFVALHFVYGGIVGLMLQRASPCRLPVVAETVF